MKITRRGFIQGMTMSALWAGLKSHSVLASHNEPQFRFSNVEPLQTPMQEIYPTVFNGEIYVSGGFVPSDTPTFFGLAPSHTLHIYSPTSQSWRFGPPFPELRHHLALLSNSSYLYGVGGFTGDQNNAWQIQHSVFRKGSADSKWYPGPALPSPISEAVYATCGESLHVIGGVTHDKTNGKTRYSNQHYVLIDNNHWENAAPPTMTRSSAAGTQINDKIYTFGGRQAGKQAKTLTFAEVYDKQTDRWETISPMPAAVAGLTAVPFDGKILVAGGEAFGPQGNWKTGTAHDYLWLYDPINDNWSDPYSLPQARHGHGAVNLNGDVYLIGGAQKVGPQDTTSSVLKIVKTTT